MLVFLQVIGESVYEFVFAQDDLPLDIEHNRLFIDSPFNKLAVFLFCFVSFSAELPEDPIRGEAGVGLFLACRGAVAAPLPLLGVFYHPCPEGIQDDVSADFEEMAVFLDKDSFESALEKVAVSFVTLIKELGVDAVKLSHAEGEVAVGCFDQKMIVVAHEAVSVAQPVVTLVDVLKGVEEILAVLVVFEDGFLFIAARGNMVYGTRVLYAKWTGHGEKVA